MDLRWWAILTLGALLLTEELRLSWVREELATERTAHEKLRGATALQNEKVDGMKADGEARDAAATARVDRAVRTAARPIPPGTGPEAMNAWLTQTFT